MTDGPDVIREGANNALDAIIERHRKSIEQHGVDEAEQLLIKTLFAKNRNNIHEVVAQLVGRYALLMTRAAQNE